MLTLFLQAGIILSLLYGAYSDIKTRTVSDYVAGVVVIFSMFLIITTNITIYNMLFIAFLLAGYSFNGIGGADVKVLIPISLTFNLFELLAYIVWLAALGLLAAGIIILSKRKLREDSIPFFVIITLAYFPIFMLKILSSW